MAESAPIGALAVRITADVSDFVGMLGKADTALEKFSKKVDKHAKSVLSFGAAASAAAVAVFEFTRRTSESVDEIGKLSQKVGVSVEALSGLKFAAELSDVSLDQLGTGLKQLGKHMAEAAAGSKESREAFETLFGKDWAMKDVETQLLDIAEEFKKTEDGAGKTAIAMKIFGKAGADLIPLLNQGRDGIEELRKEAERLGVVFSTEAAKKAEEFNDNLVRVKSAASGLAVELAGPLVDALNEVSKTFLESRKAGETWVESLLSGWRRLATGDDLHKFNVEMFKAVERLGAAQNNYDRLRNMGGSAAAMGLRKAREELAAAEADVKRLQKIKETLLGDKAKDPVPVSGMDHESAGLAMMGKKSIALVDDKAKREEEQRNKEILEARQKALGEANKIELDAIAHRNDALQKSIDLAREYNFQVVDMSEKLIRDPRAMDEEQQFVPGGADKTDKLVFLRESLKTEEELQLDAHARKMAQLKEFTDEELAHMGGRAAVIEQIENEHQVHLLEIRGRGLRTLAEFNKASWQQQTKTVFGELANLTAGVAQSNKTLFNLNKVAGIANAIVSAYEGISLTMAKYPYPLNIAMAAAHGVAAFAQVNAIRSTSFGGGGGAAPSLAGGTAAMPVTPVAQGAALNTQRQTTVINLQGETFGRQQLRSLLEQVSEEMRDGGKLVVA